jgi:hypothetical protein
VNLAFGISPRKDCPPLDLGYAFTKQKIEFETMTCHVSDRLRDMVADFNAGGRWGKASGFAWLGQAVGVTITSETGIMVANYHHDAQRSYRWSCFEMGRSWLAPWTCQG